MVADRVLLRREFDADDGTFLLQIRGLVWDRDAFSTLEAEMRKLCFELESETRLDRWIANGFWILSDWLRTWTSHPDFPRPEPTYYEAALQRMWDLQYWLMMGQSPYLPTHEWEPL